MAKAAVKREPSKLACNWPSVSCLAEGKLFALNNVMSPFFFIVTLPVKASIIPFRVQSYEIPRTFVAILRIKLQVLTDYS